MGGIEGFRGMSEEEGRREVGRDRTNVWREELRRILKLEGRSWLKE